MPEGTQVLQSFKSATEGAQKAEQELPSTCLTPETGGRTQQQDRSQVMQLRGQRYFPGHGG